MNIVFGLDQSKYSKSAMAFFRNFRLPSQANVYLVHAIPEPESTMEAIGKGKSSLPKRLEELRKALRAQAELFLTQLGKALKGEDLEVKTIIAEGAPGEEVLKVIRQHRAQLVVLGSRGLSRLKRFFLGSVSEWVLRDASCSVLLARPTAKPTKSDRVLKILFATDGSPDSKSAVDLLNAFEFTIPPKIILLHVVRKHVYETEQVLVSKKSEREEFAKLAERLLEDRGREGIAILQDFREGLSSAFTEVEERLAYGHEAHEILKAARQTRADLVVVGSRGQTGLRKFFLGSVSEKVVHHAPCSVLVTRPTDLPI